MCIGEKNNLLMVKKIVDILFFLFDDGIDQVIIKIMYDKSCVNIFGLICNNKYDFLNNEFIISWGYEYCEW